MTKALIVQTNGEMQWADIETDLSTLNRLVGGYIELVYVNPGVHAYINEEGKILGLPINPVATFLSGLAGVDVLCGTAVFFGSGNMPEEGDLPDEWSEERLLPYVRRNLLGIEDDDA